MFAALQVSAAEVATEVEMPLAPFYSGTHFVDWHLAILQVSIPNAERCTRWRPHDPFRIVIGYHLARHLAVLALVKVSWTAVRLVRSEIKGPETVTVERPPSSIGLGHSRAMIIHVHESCGTWIAYDLIDKQLSGILASTGCDERCLHCRCSSCGVTHIIVILGEIHKDVESLVNILAAV